MAGGPPPDYVDVAERIRAFYAKYPDGSLVRAHDPYVLSAAGKEFVVAEAFAYRNPDDKIPGWGVAWEPVPGPTPFTRDSELMNAQTSAWGRAIVSLGFETKHIASANEVRNRSASDGSKEPAMTKQQRAHIFALLSSLEEIQPKGKDGWKDWLTEGTLRRYGQRISGLNRAQAGHVIEGLQKMIADLGTGEREDWQPDAAELAEAEGLEF